MNNLQRRPEQEPDALLYDPKCAVQSPEAIRSWAKDLGIDPRDCRKIMDGFLILIPFYHANEDGTLPNSPEYWQRNLLSYSFYLGLGITIFKRDIAFYLLHGATEGCSREALFWLNEVKKSGCQDKVQQWHYAINVLSVFTEGYSPETTGPNADAKLVRERIPIAGLTPAIRLGINDPEFAKQLFEGGIDEREKCNDEELAGRIEWMKEYVLNSYSQKETQSSN
jgi:hypothetical protein